MTGWNWVVIGLSVALTGLILWMVLLQMRLSRLSRHYTQLMRGVNGANLDEVLNQHVSRVQEAVHTVSTLETETRRIDRTLRHTVQWMGVVRFNPFRNTGGDQSFAWALVDGYGNGVVTSEEWRICGGAKGNPGYELTRQAGVFGPAEKAPGPEQKG